MTGMTVTFTSGGDRIVGRWWTGGVGVRPCVVLVHGFGGTVDSGLEPYAARFAAAGLHVLAFDYRGFGRSDGAPRQWLDQRRQLADVAAALAYARSREDVAADRVGLWGTSYGGGHVVAAAAADGRVAAVVSQCPSVDGPATALRALRANGVGPTLLGLRLAVLDEVAARTGGPPRLIPIMGPPGTVAAMTAPDVVAGFGRIVGPTFRNEVCARVMLRVATYRPGRSADRLPCRWLVHVCLRDSVAPASAALRAAARAGDRATVRELPIGHFDVYVGQAFEAAVSEQAAFLVAELSGDRAPSRPGA